MKRCGLGSRNYQNTLNFIETTNFTQPLKPQCFIPLVSTMYFLFYQFQSLIYKVKNNIIYMKQYVATSLNQFLNETLNSTEYFNLSEIVDDEIRVYESSIRELCRGIGEGIDDIDVISKSMSGAWKPNTNEIQNEICITFIENAWGGISIDEWNGVDKKLKQLEGKNGFYSFYINPNRNLITLEFDSDLPLGLY